MTFQQRIIVTATFFAFSGEFGLRTPLKLRRVYGIIILEYGIIILWNKIAQDRDGRSFTKPDLRLGPGYRHLCPGNNAAPNHG